MSQVKSAAVTGAGGGLGRELAICLAGKGYTVFGTAFSENEITEAKGAFADLDIWLTVADVTAPEKVAAWAAKVSSESPEGLDLLINNAGVLTPGPMEVLKLDAIRHEFEVNVFGSLSVVNAFLPSLRRKKGRIVQVSSGSGFFALPFSGPSSASKAAMESFADVFRTELRPFGIAFTVVEPGNMATGGPAKTAAMLQRVAESMSQTERDLYGDQFSRFTSAMNAMQQTGMAAAEAASRLVKIAEQEPPPTRARIGDDAEELYQMARKGSDEELDALRRKMFQLGE